MDDGTSGARLVLFVRLGREGGWFDGEWCSASGNGLNAITAPMHAFGTLTSKLWNVQEYHDFHGVIRNRGTLAMGRVLLRPSPSPLTNQVG